MKHELLVVLESYGVDPNHIESCIEEILTLITENDEKIQ